MKAKDAVAFLAQKRRVLLLGGMAVILHGLSRNTKDYDIWLDPIGGADAWADSIKELFAHDSSLRPQRIGALPSTWQSIPIDDISSVGSEDRLVRVAGADRPIDIFWIPNELSAADFDAAWQRGTPLDDGVRLMEEIDLIVTKQLTGRAHDETDIRFLEEKIEAAYKPKLCVCSAEEAERLLSRFATPQLAAVAVRNKSRDVRAVGWRILNEMREAGDPFAAEFLEELSSLDPGKG